jgi:hypothetical protein
MTVEAALIAGMQAALDQRFADCTLSDPRRMAAALRAVWQPIATAPTDARIVLYRPSSPVESARVVLGWYAASSKRPYWTHDLEAMLGIREARRHQPTHWCPVFPPLPPTDD